MNLDYLLTGILLGICAIGPLLIGISYLAKKGFFYRRNQQNSSDTTIKYYGFFYISCSIILFILASFVLYLYFFSLYMDEMIVTERLYMLYIYNISS